MRDHAEVAVAGFARMHEKRRGAGGRQGGGDLAADVPGLAHARHHHAAAAGQDQVHGVGKTGVEAGGRGTQGVGFDVEHLARKRKQMFGGGGLGSHGRQVY